MNLSHFTRKREETADFSKSNYEVVFSVFMVVLAYFYRQSPLISYPEVLYLFMSLLAANFAFNRILSERSKISLWLVDVMLLCNIGIITAILLKSGGYLSYFWVLYLLPIFTAALTGRLPEVSISAGLCVLALGISSLGPVRVETAQLFAFFTKLAVFVFSAFVIYRMSLAKRRMETEVTFKRFQVEKLLAAVSEHDSKARMEASAAEVGRMTASLLHDLGNVVSIILMSAEIMVKEKTPDLKDVQRVQQAARMAKCIIDGSLALIKGDRYEFSPAPLQPLMENAAAIFAMQARGKGVKILMGIEEGLPDIKMSAPHMQRVFINTIANSLLFLKSGGIISLKAVRTGNLIQVSIEDDGPGFTQPLLVRGITAFGTTRKEKGGTGLGLFNSKEIVEKHGGKFSIRNNQPSGAVVEFTLPVAGSV